MATNQIVAIFVFISCVGGALSESCTYGKHQLIAHE